MARLCDERRHNEQTGEGHDAIAKEHRVLPVEGGNSPSKVRTTAVEEVNL
jgi:hypothetical protein